jgi:non-homologous end joining protein Ku
MENLLNLWYELSSTKKEELLETFVNNFITEIEKNCQKKEYNDEYKNNLKLLLIEKIKNSIREIVETCINRPQNPMVYELEESSEQFDMELERFE